jgi:hypothetical protein
VLGSPAETGRLAAQGFLEQWASAGAASPLDAIALVQGAARAVDDGMQRAVQRAREAGHTWAEVGQVLGTTRQAAFQRFGRPADSPAGLPPARPVLPGAAERGGALFADMASGRWADVCRDFDEAVASKLDADGVAARWARLTAMIGRLEERGGALFADMAAGRWADVCRDFDEAVASKLDADGVAARWARLTAMIGRLEERGEPVAYQLQDITVVDVRLEFEAGERTGRVSYRRDGKVAGLFLLPPGLT